MREDRSLPVEKIEGSSLVEIRFPFKVSLPSPQWKFSLGVLNFGEDLGSNKRGLPEAELFFINPATTSNIPIDLTPAGKRTRFNQRVIGGIAAARPMMGEPKIRLWEKQWSLGVRGSAPGARRSLDSPSLS